MNRDAIGRTYYTADELADILYANPAVDLSGFLVEDPAQYNKSVKDTWAEFESLREYFAFEGSVEMFDEACQAQWHMPAEYQDLDIAAWILSQCHTEAELQRCGEELLLYQQRDLFDLLRWLKYFVDTMREHNIVWGVGRGSSVASYVLYLFGVHRVNSMYYDLNITEFLK